MAEITKEQFKVVGKNTKTMESISRPNIGYWQDAWRRIRKNKIAFFSLCLIGLYVLMAIFVPMFSKYDIATQSVAEMNQSFSKAHWFGTDSLGRDLWVRAWSGARVSLTIGFAASIINAIVGSIMGGISGFYGGKIDMVIQRVVDVQSNLRISDQPIASDLIPSGKCDLIISLEPMEGLRYLPYLNSEGWLVTNETPFVNIPNYPAEADVRAELDKLHHKIVLNVDKVAKEIGSIRVANIVLLGATIPFLGIDYEKIQTSIREIFERKGEAIVEMNLKALAAGKEIAEKLM